jgi:hypothetical protein
VSIPRRTAPSHPALVQHAEDRAQNIQNRIADTITRFAGSNPYKTGSAGGRRPHATTAGVLLRSAGHLMTLSRLIQRAVPFPPLGKDVIAVAVKR